MRSSIAAPRTVDIALRPCSAGLTLTIRDDGHGFDPEAACGDAGLGLQSMAARASRPAERVRARFSPRRDHLDLPHPAIPEQGKS